MGFELFCATLIALAFGTLVCFGGYRLFLFLLPIWGFFFGFGLGAQSIQAIFGDAFLGTVTSWVVGFIVALIFGVLSYLFYIFGVAIVAGSLGYAIGAGLMHAIGLDLSFLVWLVGIIAGAVVVVVTLLFNLQKYVIVAATALGGAAIAIGTLLVGAEGLAMAQSVENPVQALLSGRPVWTILFLVMVVAGIVVQIRSTQVYYIEPYENRI